MTGFLLGTGLSFILKSERRSTVVGRGVSAGSSCGGVGFKSSTYFRSKGSDDVTSLFVLSRVWKAFRRANLCPVNFSGDCF